MSKNKGNNNTVEVNEEDEEAFDLTGGDQGEQGTQEGSLLAGEEETHEEPDLLEDQEDFEGDWKEARKLLKAADEKVSYSIDDYVERLVIDDLKRRYNAKERTVGLFNAIEAL